MVVMAIPHVKWRLENRGTIRDPRWFVIRETRGSGTVRRIGPAIDKDEAKRKMETLKRSYVP